MKDSKLWKLLSKLFWANCVSFLVFRLASPTQGVLQVYTEATSDFVLDGKPVMNYLIAGCYNQANTAFDFLLNEIEGGITFVNFEQHGWRPKKMADLILRDARKHGYAVRILSISMGDQVARYVEDELGGECEILAINPCSSVQFLKTPLRLGITFIAAPALEILSLATGWLSRIPFLPTGVAPYSLALTADQYAAMAYESPPTETNATKWVIISKDDGYVNTGTAERFFRNAEITYLDTGHINQHANGDLYRDAYRKLMGKAPN